MNTVCQLCACLAILPFGSDNMLISGFGAASDPNPSWDSRVILVCLHHAPTNQTPLALRPFSKPKITENGTTNKSSYQKISFISESDVFYILGPSACLGALTIESPESKNGSSA